MSEMLNHPLILFAGSAGLLLTLAIWIVFRNGKDEKDFEKNMDDPHQQSIHHLKHDEEKI